MSVASPMLGIFEEKEEEQWELNTFVDCEVLGWKGIDL